MKAAALLLFALIVATASAAPTGGNAQRDGENREGKFLGLLGLGLGLGLYGGYGYGFGGYPFGGYPFGYGGPYGGIGGPFGYGGPYGYYG